MTVRPVVPGDPEPAADRAASTTLRRWLALVGLDRAVFYAVLARGWQLVAGPVSMVVIARFYSPAEQGLFYTFSSLMLMHNLVELGLHGVVTTIASHDWAGLELDAQGTVVGDVRSLRRLARLSQTTHVWYGWLAVLFGFVAGGAGYAILANGDSGEVAWQAPWVALVTLTAPTIWLWSRVAVLEGCNQVAAVNRLRFAQACTGTLAVWPAIILGWGLWATVVAAAVRLAWDAWFARVRFGPFFRALEQSLSPTDEVQSVRRDETEHLWREEVWPLQWRMGVRTLFNYFGVPIMTPVVYASHGPAAAGLLGMTLTALQALEGAGFAWVQTRAPRFGMLIARREFTELDRLHLRVSLISTAVLALGGGAFLLIVGSLPLLPWPMAQKLSERLAGLEPTAVLIAAMLVFNAIRCLGLYVYVHKRDPFLWPGVISSSCLGLCIWWGGRTYGIEGVAWGYLLGLSTTFLPAWLWIFHVCRRDWHRPDELHSA